MGGLLYRLEEFYFTDCKMEDLVYKNPYPKLTLLIITSLLIRDSYNSLNSGNKTSPLLKLS